MQKADLPRPRWQNLVLFLIAFLILAADQFTKSWIRSFPEGQTVLRIGFFQIAHIQNTGAAFGIFQGLSGVLAIFSMLGVALILLYAFFLSRRFPAYDNRLNRVALGLILGGTAGNLIDRFRFGYVIDFIDFHYWPAFNIADPAIVVGTILFAYSIIFLIRPIKQ
jgi:signal peptidase II